MQFNVSQLMREPIGSRRQYQVNEEFQPVEGEPPTVMVSGPVDLLRTDRGILATSELRSEASGECDRCLRPVRYPVTLQIEEEFLPTLDPATGGAAPRPTKPDVSTIDERHILDLTDVAQQSWLLNAPMRVLCREDCGGICPECGQDRNDGMCTCNQAPIDSRWAALSALTHLNGDHEREL